MPLIPIVRAFLSFLGLFLVGLALYLLWTWWGGSPYVDQDGVERLAREDWRLWTALGLLAWSLLGRLPTLFLLARRDEAEPTRPLRSSGAMIRSPTGAELYVETHGPEDSPALIATHGWGLDSTIWQYLKRRFAAESGAAARRLTTWDLPGLGRSKAPPSGEIALRNFAADLEHLIAGVGDRPVVLLGHSIGGMTIQTLARDRPDLFGPRIAGVILINTTYTNPLATMILSGLARALRKPVLEPVFKLTILLKPMAWLSAWQGYLNGTAHIANRLQFGTTVTRSQLEHTTLLGTRNPPDVLAKGNLAMFDWDASGAVAAMACPVLIIGGEIDIVTKLEASESMARQAQGARLERVSGANHMGFLERAQHYDALIGDFVAQVADAPGVATPGLVSRP